MQKFIKWIAVLAASAMIAASLAGCSSGSNEGGGQNQLKWYIPMDANAEDAQVGELANKIVQEKLGSGLTIVPVSFGSYESKMQVLNAAADAFDIMFVSLWSNNYYNNVSKGTLVELDGYLKEEVPRLYESIPDFLWEGVQVNGKTYAVPNQQISARAPCFVIPKQNVDLLGLDLGEYQNLEDDDTVYLDAVEKYLRKLHDATGSYCSLDGIWADGAYMFGMDEILGGGLPGAIRVNGSEKTRLFNQYESQEFVNYIHRRREWVTQGLVQPEKTDNRSYLDQIANGEIVPAMERANTYLPGVENSVKNTEKYDAQVLIRTKPLLTSGAICATMNGVSTTSENPRLAVKLLELVNTDKELYNLISFGIEGVNYKKTGENRMEKIEAHPYNCSNWTIGCVYNSYLQPAEPDNAWEETRRINREAERSPLLGFSPNLDNLKPQIASCKSAIDEFFTVLDYGIADVDTQYPQFIAKLKAAGVDMILGEIQEQIDNWLAGKA